MGLFGALVVGIILYHIAKVLIWPFLTEFVWPTVIYVAKGHFRDTPLKKWIPSFLVIL